MKIRTNIKYQAKERGYTLSYIAKKLGLYKSNLSLMDSGKRAVSMKQLAKIAEFINCDIRDLIVTSSKKIQIFSDAKIEKLLLEREKQNFDGIDKSWVPKAMYNWQFHFNKVKK